MHLPTGARLAGIFRTGLPVLFSLAIPVATVIATPAPGSTAQRVAWLDPYVVTATRTPASPRALGSVVDVITSGDLQRRQVSSFAEALAGASVPVLASGAPGASTSIFLRGANSNQTLFLVDGLRFNDPNTDYAVFLGGSCVSACDSLEISHGPQSTLYGGEAVGGVISLRSQRGTGTASSRIAVEGGSFGTIQGAISSQGERPGGWAYNVAVQGGVTENDRINNDFRSGNLTARVDRTVSESLGVGATLRGFQGNYGSPGSRFVNDPDNEERESNWLGTVFADWIHSREMRSHVVVGGQSRRFASENPSAGFPTSTTIVKNRRTVIDWQTTYDGIDGHRITGGFTGEANHTLNTGFGAIDDSQHLLAFFLQDEITPTDNLHLTAGLRHDDFDTFGRHTTGRASAAWLVLDGRLKFRGSWGTAFRSPSFLDLYGQSAFYVGNPDLKPERARGGDVGFDWYLSDNRGSVGVTWFDTRFRDLIVSDFSQMPSSVANVGRARTRGIELSTQVTIPAAAQIRLSYTYLEADNESSGRRLLRRPRHAGNLDLWKDFGRGFSAGAGLRVVLQREDVHAATFATVDGEDYSVVRIYGAWAINERLTVKARVENLLDEKYEEVHGYPQLPVGGFAGLEWRF